MNDTSQLVERATTILIHSMTQDDALAWQSTVNGFSSLFAKASHVAVAELERSRTEVTSHPELAAEAAGEWKPKLRRLLQANPDTVARLQALLRELDAIVPQTGVSNQIIGPVWGTAVQAHTIHGGVGNLHYDGDHIDFSHGKFKDETVGKKVENTHVDQSQARPGQAGT